MHPKLRELIFEYLARTAEATVLLQRHLGGAPMDWRSAGHHQMGQTDEGVRYYFHGSGVAVHLPDCVVDFDFGFEGRINGFSPWTLAGFARHLGPDFKELQQWLHVQDLLTEAEQNGEIDRPFLNRQDDLFYLTSGADQAAHQKW